MLSFSVLHAAQHGEAKDNPASREMPAVFLAGDREASLAEAAQGIPRPLSAKHTAHLTFSPVLEGGRLEQRPSRPVSMVGPGFEA